MGARDLGHPAIHLRQRNPLADLVTDLVYRLVFARLR
jgi:hypothetical protein